MADLLTMFMYIYGILLVVGIVYYVYTSWVRMVIARKLNNPHPWLAWIPIAREYQLTELAGVQWWTFLLFMFIPFVNIGIWVWWWWKIAEARGKPGWFSILMLIPIVGMVVQGIIAWSD